MCNGNAFSEFTMEFTIEYTMKDWTDFFFKHNRFNNRSWPQTRVYKEKLT